MRSFVPDYDLIRARDVAHATALLKEGFRPIAGGTDLMVLFNAGKLPYRKVVSIRRLPELTGVVVSETSVAIGAAVTYTQIRRHEALNREFPLLCSAASWTGSLANQNRGTLGGNIVNASPAADSAPALLVYDADLEFVSAAGVRRLPYRDFHFAYKRMNMQEDELLHMIHLSRNHALSQQYIRKVGPRKAQAISKVVFAAGSEITGKVISDVRVAVGSVAPVPLRCYRTEQLLNGRRVSAPLIEQAAQTIAAEVQPITDIRSTESYRRMVVVNLLSEFLRTLE
ncbi:MAG: FAD binding domain-containing protein [Acidobacteriaceae bacterium]|nr:FAD binding domain-containing protein [Acidobacteriaceae bacterium]